MGLLRFLLAVSVLLGHAATNSDDILFVDAHLAVEIFFMISGFYITLILQEKYILTNNSYRLFITNRLLRLYPFYWIVLLLTVCCSLLIPNYDARAYMGQLTTWQLFHSNLNIESYCALVFTNVVLFFQDVTMFFGLDLKSGSLYFTSKYWLSNPPLFKFLPVPQAWSIGLELSFYLIAPFFVRRNILVILGIILASAIAKNYFISHGFNFDPWTYRFFPFELAFFFAGTLAYYIYKSWIKNMAIRRYVNISVYIGLALFTILYNYIDNTHKIKLYILFTFCSIPLLFKFCKNIIADKFIGELSYPMYLTHIFVFNLVKLTGNTRYQTILTLIGSVLLSIVLVKFIGEPIERYRQSRLKGLKRPNLSIESN